MSNSLITTNPFTMKGRFLNASTETFHQIEIKGDETFECEGVENYFHCNYTFKDLDEMAVYFSEATGKVLGILIIQELITDIEAKETLNKFKKMELESIDGLEMLEYFEDLDDYEQFITQLGSPYSGYVTPSLNLGQELSEVFTHFNEVDEANLLLENRGLDSKLRIVAIGRPVDDFVYEGRWIIEKL